MKTQLIITVTHPDKYPATQFIDIAIKSVLQDINADCDEGWSVSYQDGEVYADAWATNDEGDYTCVDCEELVSDEFVCGNREFSDPRCEDCYDTHRYSA
jgi:hypothetical protein